MLAEAGRRRGLARCKEEGLTRVPVAFAFRTVFLIRRLKALEGPHRGRLAELAKGTAAMVWGIPKERLEGELAEGVVLEPDRSPAHSVREALLRACVVGVGGVARRGEALVVVARGTNWQLLAKELVKGTAELICLHGLNPLSEEMYRRVIDTTDRMELEPWMLQSGGELWRRLLAAAPEGRPLARVLMELARLPAGELEQVLAGVIEEPEPAGRGALAL
jgi:hypothetical protein